MTANNDEVAAEGTDNPMSLTQTPEQKYEGTWEPGTNQPTTTLTEGDFAGRTIYLPIPEAQKTIEE